jgi:hypothetical protein
VAAVPPLALPSTRRTSPAWAHKFPRPI